MADYFNEIRQFLWAVIWNWGNLATGGVIVALLWLWSMLSRKSISRVAGIGVAIFFLLGAFFNAWRSQYQMRLEAENKLRELTATDLHGKISQVLTSPSGLNEENSVWIISMQVRNTGAPSIAVDWNILITQAGKEFRGMISDPPAEVIVPEGAEHPRMTFALSGFLPRAAVLQPIPQGGAAVGWMIVLFKGLKQGEAWAGDAVLSVRFKDINGKDFEVSMPLKKENLIPIPDLAKDQQGNQRRQ